MDTNPADVAGPPSPKDDELQLPGEPANKESISSQDFMKRKFCGVEENGVVFPFFVKNKKYLFNFYFNVFLTLRGTAKVPLRRISVPCL